MLEEAGDGTQLGTERAEFLHVCSASSAATDAVAVNLVTRLLLQPRLAAVGHGLVERLEVFEGGVGLVRSGRAEVLVQPPMRLPAGRRGAARAVRRQSAPAAADGSPARKSRHGALAQRMAVQP